MRLSTYRGVMRRRIRRFVFRNRGLTRSAELLGVERGALLRVVGYYQSARPELEMLYELDAAISRVGASR